MESCSSRIVGRKCGGDVVALEVGRYSRIRRLGMSVGILLRLCRIPDAESKEAYSILLE